MTWTIPTLHTTVTRLAVGLATATAAEAPAAVGGLASDGFTPDGPAPGDPAGPYSPLAEAAPVAPALPAGLVAEAEEGLYRCACGTRQVPADMLVDLTPLAPALRAAVGLARSDYACDGCVARALARGLTLEALHAAHGAPAAVLARCRAADAAAGRAPRA